MIRRRKNITRGIGKTLPYDLIRDLCGDGPGPSPPPPGGLGIRILMDGTGRISMLGIARIIIRRAPAGRILMDGTGRITMTGIDRVINESEISTRITQDATEGRVTTDNFGRKLT